MKLKFSILLSFILLSACAKKEESSKLQSNSAAVVEAISFAGTDLLQRQANDELLGKHLPEIKLIKAKADLQEEDYLSIGYHYATVFQYNNAIQAYSDGLAQFPDSYKLLRFRAHRYLSTRKVNEALIDLEKALTLINDSNKDEVEYYDNGEVKGTYEFWIYYHLGLAHYLNGDYDQAIEAYKGCQRTAITPNNRVGATDWLFNSYFKAGKIDEAEALVENFEFGEDADMNYAYSKRVLLYQGKSDPETLIDQSKPSREWSGSEITLAYGLGNWYKLNGEEQKGIELHKRILDSPYWNAWAYVVADKEQSEL